jgi:hypothetical protein
MTGAEQGLRGGHHVTVRVYEVRGPAVQIRAGGICCEDLIRQRL